MELNLKKFSTGGGDESTTTNLGLSKPLSSDNYNIAIQNSNMDKIDNAVAALEQRMTVVRAELWTNSNPTAKFPSQTVSVPNLSSYDEIEVFFITGVEDNMVFKVLNVLLLMEMLFILVLQ